MNAEISVCLSAIHGTYLEKSLESIFNNKFQDFEVIVNDSSKNFILSDIIKKYDAKIIKKETKTLESRYLTIKESKGKNILLLDETRIINSSLLEKLNNLSNDLIVIGEMDMGRGLLIKLSNLDKKALPENPNKLSPYINKTIIPRYYNSKVIKEAIEKIKNNLPPEIFKNAVALDLELIYLESYNISKDIGIIKTPEIFHYGDETFKDVFNKYYKYGYSQKMFKNTCYSEFSNLSGRNRASSTLKDRILSIPIQIIRGIPFLLGYISV